MLHEEGLDHHAAFHMEGCRVRFFPPEEVCVTIPDEAIPMTNEWGANGTVRFSANSVRFLRDQTTTDTPIYAMFDGLSAGHFEGTATFTIQLKQRSDH